MLLYTLVVKENNTFKLLGSTFESDVAIYLYYKNKKEYENIFFLWSEVKYTYFNNFVIDEYLDNRTIYFLGKNENGNLSELLFEDPLNIYKLTSEYISNESLCLEIKDFNEYCDIIKKYKHKKNEILPPSYKEQDTEYLQELSFYNEGVLEDIFVEDEDYDILFIGVVKYIKEDKSYLVATGCGYEEEAVAFHLNQFTNELTDIKFNYNIISLFVPKENIEDYLNKNKIKLMVNVISELNQEKIEINILENNEITNELTVECNYCQIKDIQVTMYNDFIDNEWDNYIRDFEENFLEKDYKNFNEEEKIHTYIEYINNNYLENENSWFESIQLMLSASKIEDITFIMDSELEDEASTFTKNISSAFIFLKDNFESAIFEDFFDELGIVLMLKKRSTLMVNNKYQERIGAFFLTSDGIHSLCSKELKDYVLGMDLDLKTKNLTYIDGKKMLDILNIETPFLN